MQPPDLRGWAVTLLVLGGDAEDDGRLGGAVDVRRRQVGVEDHAARHLAEVDSANARNRKRLKRDDGGSARHGHRPK